MLLLVDILQENVEKWYKQIKYKETSGEVSAIYSPYFNKPSSMSLILPIPKTKNKSDITML